MIERPDFVKRNITNLHAERVERGLTTTDVARCSEINETQYSKYERGKNFPARNTYNKLAKFFGWEEWE